MPRISLENAARDLSKIIDRVRSKDTSFELIREGEVVARIVPVKPSKHVDVRDLDTIFANLPDLEAGDAVRFTSDLDTIRKEAVTPESKWD